MNKSIRWWLTAFVAVSTLVMVGTSAVVAFQVRPKTSRFDPKVVDDPTTSIETMATGLNDLPATNSVRSAWEGFRVAHGPWTVHLDRRSGAPLLVEGQGIRFPLEQGATLESIGTGLRSFIAANRPLLKAEDDELVLDRDASGQLTPDVWQVVFSRAVAGVPVVGERYVFTVGHGNLIAFGTPRWSRIDVSPFPTIDSLEALGRLKRHMELSPADGYELLEKGTLQIIPLRAAGTVGAPYLGPIGAGFTSALVWRVVLTVDGEPGTWAALVDAHTGEIRSFSDINDYAQAKGGVYPVSDDGIPPDGVEQANWPMPFANINLGAQTTTSTGLFSCTPGGSVATTTLAGPYVRVVDTCGAISASVTCEADLNLGASAGTDCTTPGAGGAGNTHASRTGFYHLNRIAEHARYWLPSRVWLTQQLTDNVNLNQTCNAYWNGTSVNFFKSGGGCRNTGEIAGVFLHEWGHGLDSNDGGGTDSPGEAYADITAIMSTHVSCVGRGFDMSANCGGYGDACLNCTGIRDQDWNQHASHAPATPSGFVTTFCPATGTRGPCNREAHCEAHVSAEAMWDLATRDLPASGLDLASSWQLADKLWYKSRLGSGGNAYNCALPSSDGCAVTSWFSKLRAIDDDDGNLANGTPHAAAIYAAFNRHTIACGLAGDASNQSTSSCPAIGAAVLTSLAGSGSAILNWSAVANATAYNILRNDASCDAGSTVVATVAVPTTTYTDTGLANGFAEFYRVQAVGANPACDGLLSNCQTVVPQPYSGVVKFDKGSYSCSGVINVTVTDGNIPGSTATVLITSGTEAGGETITVTQIGGSADYAGTISTTSAPAAADGAISVANGDTITGTYIDADDGIGGTNITRTTTAAADCIGPIISNVHNGAIGSTAAQILWDTNEAANSNVTYGLTPPPGTTGPVNPTLTTTQSYVVTGLSTCSTYVYSVTSADGVGNLASDDNAGAYYTFTTGADATKVFPYAGGPVAIPDNVPAGGTATITVPDNAVISDVNVTINNVTHTYDSDVVVHLIGPDNTDVILANHRGASGDNFTNTVFDDSAATPISTGVAPFTGSFIPDSPLSAFNGKISVGAWKLLIVDSVAQDSGTITSWTLTLKLAQPCIPHATYGAHALVTDTCSGGGPAGGNNYWDSGEQVQFKVTASSDGTVTLTGVTATVVPITAGVTMVDGTASYPDIPGSSTADSAAPHFTAQLPAGLACGSSVSFQVTVNANEGSWSSNFNQQIGQVVSGGGNVLNETFAAGIPATWTIVDGGSGGAPAAVTWTAGNPGVRAISAPMSAPVAIVDSDNAGNTPSTILQDEQLITPVMNLSTATTVTLQFDQFFRWFSGGMSESADVDVRSTLTGGAWVNVLHQAGASSADPNQQTINVTAQAAGAPDFQVRFHYYNGHWEWYWIVDNVKVDYTAPGGCNQPACAAPAGVAKPVGDGSFGTPMTGTRSDPSGTTIDLAWDVSTCSSTDHHVLYGDLANVSLSTVDGSYCDLGTSGIGSWTGVPAGDLWFVVVGDDDISKEGSWGSMTSGERGGASASGQCGMTTRDNSATCP